MENASPDLKDPLPVGPSARSVYVFECRDGPEDTPTAVVDGVTGIGFRRETSGLYGAIAPPVSCSTHYISSYKISVSFERL